MIEFIFQSTMFKIESFLGCDFRCGLDVAMLSNDSTGFFGSNLFLRQHLRDRIHISIDHGRIELIFGSCFGWWAQYGNAVE